MAKSLIGLLDCNNFFVSCERVFRPDLQNRPVVVLSNNDGCVIARSQEVKAMGIPMGTPFFKVRPILAAHNTVVFSSNFSLYGDLSARVMSIVESLVPRAEVYSIDEIFIDFSGIKDPEALARKIQQQVLQQVGIPTCVGISYTKTLAKVANHVAKKNPSYKGICFLEKEEMIDNILKHMVPADIWGIGRKSSEKLISAHIITAYHLKQADHRWMRKYFTITGERIVLELNGISCLQIDDILMPRQSMQVTRTFAYGIQEFAALREKIAGFAAHMGKKLRQHALTTPSISLFIRTNTHKKDVLQYKNTAITALPFSINDDFTLITVSTKLLESLYRPGFSFHKAGIMVHDLTSSEGASSGQLTLFEERECPDPKIKDLMKALDGINKRYGQGTLRMASCGVPKRSYNSIDQDSTKPTNPLQGRQQRKSPSYTTKWLELPIVK